MTLPLSLILSSLLPLAGASGSADAELHAAPIETELDQASAAKVGSKLAAYMEAFSKKDAKKKDKTYKAFIKEFTNAGKKTEGKDLLLHPKDLQSILHSARGWSKRGLLTGSVGKGKNNDPLINWYYRVPKTYDPRKMVLPLMLVVYPPRSDVKADLNKGDWLDETLTNQATIVGTEMPPAESKRLYSTLLTLKDVRETFRINHDQVFLVTSGELAPFVIELANRFPHLFAGVVLLDPAGDPPVIENLSNLPFYVAGGEDSFKTTFDQAGVQVVEGERAGAKIAEWSLGTQRSSYPDKISFRPPGRGANQAYWIRFVPEWTLDPNGVVDLSDEKRAKLKVELDRENNKIQIDAEKISFIEILLNDDIVDLDETVSVTINGKALEFSRSRNMEYFLEYFKLTLDRGTVFTTSYAIRDVPPPPSDEEEDGK